MYGHDGQDYTEKRKLKDEEKKNIIGSAMLTWMTLNQLINEDVPWSNVDENLTKAHTVIKDIRELDLTASQLEQKLRTIKTYIDSALGQLEERQGNE